MFFTMTTIKLPHDFPYAWRTESGFPANAMGSDRSKNRNALNAEINKLTAKKSSDNWVRNSTPRV